MIMCEIAVLIRVEILSGLAADVISPCFEGRKRVGGLDPWKPFLSRLGESK